MRQEKTWKNHGQKDMLMAIKNKIMLSPLKGGRVPHVWHSPDNHLLTKIPSAHDVVFKSNFYPVLVKVNFISWPTYWNCDPTFEILGRILLLDFTFFFPAYNSAGLHSRGLSGYWTKMAHEKYFLDPLKTKLNKIRLQTCCFLTLAQN